MNFISSVNWDRAVVVWLPYLLSIITLWQATWAGNKHPHAWTLGMVNQLLWLGWIVYTGNDGLLILNLGLWAIYIRNHRVWRRA